MYESSLYNVTFYSLLIQYKLKSQRLLFSLIWRQFVIQNNTIQTFTKNFFFFLFFWDKREAQIF